MKGLIGRAVALAPLSWRQLVRSRLPKPVARRIGRMAEGHGRRARQLELKLWGGFSQTAIEDLVQLKTHPDTPPLEISAAARALGSWYASRGDFARAYQEAVWMRVALPGARPNRAQVLLESDCLTALGRPEEARRVLAKALERSPSDVHLHLAMANTYAGAQGLEGDDVRLEWINRSFLASDLAPLEKRDPEQPLGIDNLQVGSPLHCSIPRDRQPKVTVLVPVFAAASTLHLALDSLLAQTWENLEVIVIDDQSPDGTFGVARAYAARDSRVIALQQSENAGAYAARNTGLLRATGSFVTVHDADDWSHPQKIEVQARHLAEHPETIGNATCWVRCNRRLQFRRSYFQGSAQLVHHFVNLNTSSLMFRTADLKRLGGWDEVRAAADTELRLRLEQNQATKNIPRLQSTVPLSFGLEISSSLTKSSKTHVHTVSHGVRRTYHTAARYWRETHTDAVPALPPPGQGRAFPAPPLLLPKAVEHTSVDLLFIMDFALHGGAFASTMNYIHAAARLGKRVGVFHWRRYDLHVAPPRRELLKLAQEGVVSMVSPGERVTADAVIVGYPVILRYPIDLAPEIECRHFAVLTNQMWARLYSGGDVQYDPRQIAANVQRLFGVSPVWTPISELVRDLMVRDGRYDRIHLQTWTPLIDSATWLASQPCWRGAGNKAPVVGRHARDHYTKWPSSPNDILTAYCADQRCQVTLLGGAKIPKRLLGRIPKNWQVHSFDSMDAQAFLAGLDFYVHYPHEDYIEEFGRAVLEAMAAGVPAILPPVFQRTFGDAALYAKPSEVWSVIEKIWSSERAWLERVEAGRRFVADNCDWSQLESRLRAFELEGEQLGDRAPATV